MRWSDVVLSYQMRLAWLVMGGTLVLILSSILQHSGSLLIFLDLRREFDV